MTARRRRLALTAAAALIALALAAALLRAGLPLPSTGAATVTLSTPASQTCTLPPLPAQGEHPGVCRLVLAYRGSLPATLTVTATAVSSARRAATPSASVAGSASLFDREVPSLAHPGSLTVAVGAWRDSAASYAPITTGSPQAADVWSATVGPIDVGGSPPRAFRPGARVTVVATVRPPRGDDTARLGASDTLSLAVAAQAAR